MKKKLIYLLLIFATFNLVAQNSHWEYNDEETYVIVEEMPEFPGGQKAMLEYLYRNITYPKMARENGIQGIVLITFIILADGSITNIELKRDPGGGCGEEAKRVIKTMPKWKPGKLDGKPVAVSFNLPVNFKLDSKELKEATPNKR